MNDFFMGLLRQKNIIFALIIREFRVRNSKHAFTHLFDIVHTVFFIIAHWLIFKFAGRHLLIGDSLLTWITTGIFPVLYFRSISIRAAQGVRASKPLRTIPFVHPLDVSIAKVAIEALTFIGTFAFFFDMIYVSGESRYAAPFNLLPILESIALLTLLAFGVGLVNSFISSVFPLYTLAWSAFARVQLFFSAVFYIPEYLPPSVRYWISFNPLLHFVSLFRTGFYQSYPTHLISFSYMFWWAIGTTFVGLVLERRMREASLAY
ncbi:ABC transporter permease [Rhizobium sp. BK376]|uniref:ABC transporter permease n=1 Tax=Rhizobium sp. BK376 TaxID=2512149 RepID=UPI0010443C13|nr:ABC transporter permease [Rhizobium sp. BK376]TCR82262.1 capsular polysaccharide transport system permease protein [Rhizobium sp. BK376]